MLVPAAALQADDLMKVIFFSLLPKSSGVSLLPAARYDNSFLPPPVRSEDHPAPRAPTDSVLLRLSAALLDESFAEYRASLSKLHQMSGMGD